MEQNFDRLNWLRELAKSEDQMEETGVVDLRVGFENDQFLFNESVAFLLQLKHAFTDDANYFNQLKNSTVGRIKIYGIAKTHADFMLFRNGYKMIFSLVQPGIISVRFNFVGAHQFIPQTIPSLQESTAAGLHEENLIEAKPGPFHDLIWTFKGQPLRLEAMVKYYLTLFIRESSK